MAQQGELMTRLIELQIQNDELKLTLLNLGWHQIITPTEYEAYFAENKSRIAAIQLKISLNES